MQPVTWIAILWLGVLGSGLAMVYVLLSCFMIIGPTRTSLVTYILPPGGVLLGVIFLGEQLSWQLLAGAVLIIVSLVICKLETTNNDSEHRSGFIAIIGRPNVGKSTLVNALLGQKVAAVSPRPQTTRRRQLGILTLENAQLVFVDTPGIHQPRHKLGEFLNFEAEEALDGVDVILWLVDASTQPTEDDTRISDLLNRPRFAPPDCWS